MMIVNTVPFSSERETAAGVKDTYWLSVDQTWSRLISAAPESSSHWDSACNVTFLNTHIGHGRHSAHR